MESSRRRNSRLLRGSSRQSRVASQARVFGPHFCSRRLQKIIKRDIRIIIIISASIQVAITRAGRAAEASRILLGHSRLVNRATPRYSKPSSELSASGNDQFGLFAVIVNVNFSCSCFCLHDVVYGSMDGSHWITAEICGSLRISLDPIASHCLSLPLIGSHCFSLPLSGSRRFLADRSSQIAMHRNCDTRERERAARVLVILIDSKGI